MKNFPQHLSHASGAPLALEPTRLLLALKAPRERSEVAQFLHGLDLFLEDDPDGEGVPGERVNHTRSRYFVQARRALDDGHVAKIESAGQAIGLDWVGPVYRMAGQEGRRGLMTPLPNVGVIRLRDQNGPGFAAEGLKTQGAEPVLKEVPEKSRYLNGYRYFQITNAREVNAYELRDRIRRLPNAGVIDFQFETMPLLTPTSIAPNDTLFPQQWDMTRIEAGGPGVTGWDITTGVATQVVCVLDEGCDLTHPDLQFSDPGINLGTMMPDGSPTGNHGTACAGIVAATYNNGAGVTGVAGNARILPVAFDAWTDVEVAAGINYATANGASVISMSFGFNGWSTAIIDPAIQNAFNNNLVMCVATHNYNGPITYPATNPLVIAVGASDEVDNRKTPMSPDGEPWGSNFGPEISVVSPGVHIPTTDRQGASGYDPGDYELAFNGTSSATPHVAGLAALIRSAYPTLSNVQVRAHIERTAQKVGAVAYADTPGRPNGSWNQEMGYGRINVYRALDEADVMIKDAPADNGAEPFTGGNFWDFSDIVVRIFDDNVFVPSDPAQSKNVERGQANYIYVRVTNSGSRDARNVTVSTRITPFVGLQFVYPQDWTVSDATHVSPTPLAASFGTVPAGSTVMAKFRIEAAQVESLYGWITNSGWHPCLLAVVNADNDYAFATAPLTGDPISARRNNLAQRNLSVIDVLANASATFPFVMGNRYNLERRMSLLVDRSRLPAAMPLTLSLDEEGREFPAVDFNNQILPDDQGDSMCDNALVFLEETRIKTRFGCCTGILTLGKDSRFDCATRHKLGNIKVDGGEVVLRDGRRYVEIRQSLVRISMDKEPGAIYPLALRTTIPASAADGQQYMLGVSQQNTQGITAGGAGVVYVVR
ncbi:S8 family serine peptidase [Massilia endophytica]|uniref:S8 family serine peptidase n=1 Tax=Massilia endophytica TaxID=2899220 RepID=UPI001E57EA1C|nr:S8 family serine peptidase [Massilia endophytica]UGQ44858.1 S8 family serine peptidase [Massilia endophytica]